MFKPDFKTKDEGEKDNMYGSFSSELTKKYESEMIQLLDKVNPILKDKIDFSLCVIPSRLSQSGETQPFRGLIGLNEKILSKSIPEEIKVAILTHEFVHLNLGNSIKEDSVKKFPQIFNYYKSNVIKNWKEGKKMPNFSELNTTESIKRLTRQNMSQLNINNVSEAISDAFLQLSKAKTFPFQGSSEVIQLFNLNVFEEIRKKIEEAQTPSFRRLVEEKPELEKHLLYIMQMDDRMLLKYRDSVSSRKEVDLWAGEEAFANAIMERLTSTTTDSLQQFAPQDIWKINLAKKFLSIIKTPEDAGNFIKKIKNYEDLADFILENIK